MARAINTSQLPAQLPAQRCYGWMECSWLKKKGAVLLYWTFVLPHGRTLNTVSEGFHPDITHLGGNTETEFLYVLLQFIISKIMLLRVTSAIRQLPF